MLDQVATIFENKEEMLKKLKKKSYETYMKDFREKHGHFFREMTDAMREAEDKDKMAEEIADIFIGAVKETFETKGKIKGRLQADLNFFMIYYVFPAILMTENEYAKQIADVLCEKWGKTFKDSKIGYTTYDELYKGFQDKILGIF